MRLARLDLDRYGRFTDVHLDLQQALHAVYDAAAYEDEIYESTPLPPLEGEDAAWAAQFLPHPPRNGRES